MSIGFTRQEYWSGLPCPPPGDLPDPGIKPMYSVVPALAGEFFTTELPGKPIYIYIGFYIGYIYQFSSVAQLCLTLCDPMNRSTPGLPVHHQLPEFTQTQVHRVSDAIQPSHPLAVLMFCSILHAPSSKTIPPNLYLS